MRKPLLKLEIVLISIDIILIIAHFIIIASDNNKLEIILEKIENLQDIKNN